jgi:hypothetical protein
LSRYYTLSCLFILLQVQIYSQTCEITSLTDENIILNSVDTVVLRFLVEDAASDQLGQNGQGVCQVSLDFLHRNVSDLNMTLYSPNGNSVILVGPAVNTSSSIQAFDMPHDITFIPSSGTPNPDVGMSNRWDSQDPDWGTTSAYAGTYFPFSGDFDINFATGPVNGIWELVIVDQFPTVQNVSRFNRFSLEFCNNEISCNSCEAISGTFKSDSLAICEGQRFDFHDIYLPIADDSLYAEIFLAFSGDAIFSKDSLPDFEGEFDAYVVTILRDQEASFRTQLNTLNRVSLLDLIETRGGELCIDITRPLKLSINQSSGIMAKVARDSVYIGCSEISVDLDGSLSTATDSTILIWKGPNGQTIGNTEIITATDPGQYTLILDDRVCIDSIGISVLREADNIKAQLMATTDTLNCTVLETTIDFQTTMIVNGVIWTNDANETIGSDNMVSVNSPGRYFLEVVGEGDCAIFDSIEIYQDIRIPSAEIISDTITCISQNVQITLSNENNIESYVWTDAMSNVLSQTNTLDATKGGLYNLKLEGANTCDTTINFTVEVDTLAAELTGIPQDTFLSCEPDILNLNISSSTQQAFILAQSIDSGPFMLTTPDVLIDKGGQYRYTANFENGCISRASMNVVDERFTQSEVLEDFTLTCLIDSFQILYDIDEALYDFQWEGGSLASSNNPFPFVSQAGDYTVNAIHKVTKCISTYTISVLSDRDDPTVEVSGDTLLTCSRSIANVELTSSPNSEAYWILNDIDTIRGTLQVSSPNDYTFEVLAANGCKIRDTWTISSDQSIPIIDIDSLYTLTCETASVILSIDSDSNSQVTWYLNDGQIVLNPQIELSEAGSDSVVVIGQNGCRNSQNFEVRVDQEYPVSMILNSDTTFCTPTTILLEAEMPDLDDELSYEWVLNESVVGTGQNLLTKDIGLYYLYTTLDRNDCTASDSVNILLSDDPILGVDLEVMDESCQGEADGSLSLLSISGGVEPFNITLDGIAWNPTMVDDLKSGEFSIKIVDANSCNFDTVVSVRSGEDISVNLGPDRIINVGETITITPNLSGSINDFGWFVNGANVSQGTLDELILEVTADIELIMLVFSDNGCVASDTIYIDAVFTIDNVELYIPNAVAPNGSDRNNLLTVSLSDAILSIDKFDVYDRWGGLVHKFIPTPGRFNIELWDGRTHNNKVSPGVYIYVCEVTTDIENQKKVYTGNITVLD